MEFWGVEVGSGKSLKVTPEEGTVVHISQASLGSVKGNKGETVPLYVKVGDQKLVLGTLATERIPQLSCDLVFDKDFELSHNWGKGSVYFVGYKSPNLEEEEGEEYFSDSDSDSDSEEEENQVPSQGMDVDEEKEETPKKPEPSKKRAHEAAPKTPVSAKKAKAQVTPVKTEEKKKGGHPATPHPAKKGGKTPTTAIQSPKSASQVSCGSCKKSFNSNNALESHNKAKHSASTK